MSDNYSSSCEHKSENSNDVVQSDLIDTDDDEKEKNIDLGEESDNEAEFDSDEEHHLKSIENNEGNGNDSDSFISKTEDCDALLDGNTTAHALLTEALLGSSNENEMERKLLHREMAHSVLQDEKDENGEFDNGISMVEIDEKANVISHTVNNMTMTINNNNIIQVNGDNNVTNNNIGNTIINNNHIHHHYGSPMVATVAIPTAITACSNTAAQPKEDSLGGNDYTIPKKKKQKTYEISPQNEKVISEFEKKYCDIEMELNWAYNYRQACRGYNHKWIEQQNATLKKREGVLNVEKRKLMDMLN